MAIRAWMRRTSRAVALLLAVLALAGAVVVHHATPALAMGGMHGAPGDASGMQGGPAHHAGGTHGDQGRDAPGAPDDHAMSVAAMCLGTVAAAVAILGIVGAVLRRRRLARSHRASHAVVARLVATAPLPRARSSPLYLQLAVIRR